MAKTYEPIATQTLGSSVSTVTFSSIPSTYTDLVITVNRFTSALDNLAVQYNGDTGTNYSFTNVWGSGSAAGSSRSTSATKGDLDYYAASEPSFPAPVIINIQNYANTITYKTTLARGSNSARGVDATVVLWRSTSAINSILFKNNGGSNFTSGSMFTIYGVKSA
jgi:hypothetical protein